MQTPAVSDEGNEVSQRTSHGSLFGYGDDADDDFKRVGADDANKDSEAKDVEGREEDAIVVWPFLYNQHFQSKGIVLDAQKFMEADGIQYVLEEMSKQMN